MCYDIRYLTRKQQKYAERFGESPEEIDRLEKQLEIFHDEFKAAFGKAVGNNR